MNYFTPSNLEKRGFIGLDVNTTIAMYEYGILARKLRQGESKGKFEVVVPGGLDERGYHSFNTLIFDDIDYCISYYDWADYSTIEQFADFKLADLKSDVYGILTLVSALLSYYGCDNL